jgi:hypothetical protein
VSGFKVASCTQSANMASRNAWAKMRSDRRSRPRASRRARSTTANRRVPNVSVDVAQRLHLEARLVTERGRA